MALLIRSPQWRCCLGAAQRHHFSASAAAGAADSKGPFESIQDPANTAQTTQAQPGGRQVPGPEDEGVEREVKWGKNIPASAEQAKEEIKYAGSGLAESVVQAANVLLSKGKDAVAAAQRAVGLESDRPEMSKGTMGAAGKMEYAPPGVKSGGIGANPQAKYDEIAQTEKPNFPAGEQSVQEMFPEMGTAAREQGNTPEKQLEENERIRRQLHEPAAGGSTTAEGREPGETAFGLSGNPKDILSDNLHNCGP